MTSLPQPTRNRGFSLLEVILVLAVMAILIAFALTGYSTLVNASAITTSADTISDHLTDARAIAIAQNITVEVRLYVPTATGGPSVYSALQLHRLKSDGTASPVAKPVFLPASVVMDATAEHSPLIGANSQTVTPDASDTLLNAQTRVFHFLPDGSTDLNPSTNWFLTIRAATSSDPAHFPSNWACIRIDAVTGHIQMYHP